MAATDDFENDNRYAKWSSGSQGFFEDHPDGQAGLIAIAQAIQAVAFELHEARKAAERDG